MNIFNNVSLLMNNKLPSTYITQSNRKYKYGWRKAYRLYALKEKEKKDISLFSQTIINRW